MQAWLRSREANGAVRVSGRPSTSIASTSTYSLHRALARRRWLSLRLAPPSRAPAVSAVERCHKGPVNSLDVDRVDSRFLLSGGADASIHIFDLGMADNAPAGAFGENLSSAAQIPGKVRPLASINKSVGGTGHKFSITGVNWYPLDTGLFTSSSMDCTIKIWDTNSLESVCSFALGHRVHSHALPPHPGAHALIAAATEAPQIRLCDMRSGAFTHTLAADFVGGHISSVLTVAWSPLNEHQLASGSRDKSIRLWDIRKAKSCVTTFDQHRTVQAIDPQSQSTHPQSTERKSAQRSGSTASMPSITAHAHTAAVNGVVFTSDGINILSTGHDECIRLWNAETGLNTLVNYGPHIHNKAPVANLPAITPIHLSWPPVLFHASDNRQIIAFDLLTGAIVGRLKGHFSRVGCVALRPHSHELYSGGNDNEILCWKPGFLATSFDGLEDLKVYEDSWSDYSN